MALGGLLNQSAAVRNRAMTFPFRLAWTCALNRLEDAEEDSDNTEEAGGTGDLDGGGGAVLGGVAAAAGGATVALGGALGLITRLGVGVLATASEGALDDAVVLQLLELGASIVEVLHRDEGESTTDIVDGGESSAANGQ